MRKLFLLYISLGLIAGGCHTAKETQHIVRDSAVTQSPAVRLNPVDSTVILKQQLSDTLSAPLNFTTFYGRAKANFSSPQASGNATVYIKMQKDSIIWMSITGPLNVEGARVLITPDSVKIIYKQENSVLISSIDHLQRLTKLPLRFKDFQNIILGRPVLDDNTDLDYQFKKDSITVTATSELLKYIYSFTRNNLLLGQSNFQTANNPDVTSANIFYNNYDNVSNIRFSVSREIAIFGSSPANLRVNFKEYNFNQPQTFLFTISKNYAIRYE